MTAGDPLARAKPCLDVGFFTAAPKPMLAFWRDEIGLECEPPVAFNDGLTQYRHACGESVIKINTARDGVSPAPGAYGELLLALPTVTTPRALRDPDGNAVTLVPPGHLGIQGLAVRVAVSDRERQARFYTEIMGFEQRAPTVFGNGSSLLLLEEDHHTRPAAHWVNAGLRYLTVHVMRVDDAFEHMIAAGAEVGEAPYSIGRIARISFVRDGDGKWIEVAQRAALAGPWWQDD